VSETPVAPADALHRETRRGDWPAPVLLGAMVGAMVAGRFETGLLCIGVAVVASAAAGARWPSKSWFVAIGTGVTLAVMLNLYLTPGRALGGPRIFSLHPTAEGLRHGILFALRILGATIAVHGLRSVWPGERAADELVRLLAPLERLRLPMREARVVLGLALRFAPLLVVEARRIAALQDLRAGRPACGCREWWTRRRAVMVPTMVAALERAEQVALALEARHYRVRPIPPRARRRSGWGVAGAALAAAALLWRGR
jgi:energy-coupling factor transporter transmembrane protein EcfT